MKSAKTDVMLVTVRGFDAPGITARLTKIIAAAPGVRIIDIEQTVVHKKLILSLLLQFDHGRSEKTSALKELLFASKELGVALDFEAFDRRYLEASDHLHAYAVTCLGRDVGAKPLSLISAALAKRGVNISKIAKMTQRSLSCVELLVEAPKRLDHKTLSHELLSLARDIDIDIAIQPADLSRRAKRLVLMDMDSTLVMSEAIDELAKAARCEKKVAAITRQAMEGKIDFTESLKRRVGLLAGLPFAAVEQSVSRMKLTRGARRLVTVLKHLGYKIGVVSGGFTPFTQRLQKRLGLDFAFANELGVKNKKLTGKIVGNIIDGEQKAKILEMIARKEGVSLDQVIAVGDGANDVPMLSKAGMGIAFHAKDIVRKQAHATIGHHAGLDSLLYLLGISERELKGVISVRDDS